ncbi:hypothetical protein PM082_000684 [Marasmius tenuissimus]|nr:hypothetical protein PM082_000684 [Marasmius tenuissimus]
MLPVHSSTSKSLPSLLCTRTRDSLSRISSLRAQLYLCFDFLRPSLRYDLDSVLFVTTKVLKNSVGVEGVCHVVVVVWYKFLSTIYNNMVGSQMRRSARYWVDEMRKGASLKTPLPRAPNLQQLAIQIGRPRGRASKLLEGHAVNTCTDQATYGRHA